MGSDGASPGDLPTWAGEGQETENPSPDKDQIDIQHVAVQAGQSSRQGSSEDHM